MISRFKAVIGTSLFASFMFALPIASHAASTPVFDNWTVNGGNITAPGGGTPCGAGFTCETLSIGDGFIQVQWTAGEVSYIQTIITNPGAGGDPDQLAYVDQSFVRLGSENGIMARQQHRETDALGTFRNTSELSIGWANQNPDANNPNMTVEQSFTSAGGAAAGDEFQNDFAMLIIHGPNGETADRAITVDQRVGLGDGVTATTDVQRFVLEGRTGDFTTAGDITLGAPLGNATQGGGGSVDWDSGDSVMVRWLGQQLDLGSEGTSLFGFQGVLNETTGDEATTFSTISTGIVPDNGGYQAPFDWHATFGATAPTPVSAELP